MEEAQRKEQNIDISLIEPTNLQRELYELDEKMLNCWGIVDELKELTKNVMERDLSQDDISNILIGLYTIYEYKFQDLQMIKNKIQQNIQTQIDNQ